MELQNLQRNNNNSQMSSQPLWNSSSSSSLTIENNQNNNSNNNNNNNNNHNSLCSRNLLTIILGGQLLALLITGTGVFSQLLAEHSVNIPTTQSFLNYLLLCGFLPILIKRYYNKQKYIQLDNGNWINMNSNNNTNEQQREQLSPTTQQQTTVTNTKFLQIEWYKYLLLAFCDVEGNYLLVRAYQYTTITSVQLLDCFTIPIVMILSYFFMAKRYTRKHLIGAVICVIGLVLLLCSDFLGNRYTDSTDDEDKNILLGDSLVLLGCFFYAISNIGQEYIVKQYDRYEFLAMIGVFGSAISGIQILIFEREALSVINWRDSVSWGYALGFTVCLFTLYSGVPMLLQRSSAIFLNLSFLTADFWSILFAVS